MKGFGFYDESESIEHFSLYKWSVWIKKEVQPMHVDQGLLNLLGQKKLVVTHQLSLQLLVKMRKCLFFSGKESEECASKSDASQDDQWRTIKEHG